MWNLSTHTHSNYDLSDYDSKTQPIIANGKKFLRRTMIESHLKESQDFFKSDNPNDAIAKLEIFRNSYDEQIRAINENLTSISLIPNPSQEVQDYIMENHPNVFGLIKNPSLETCEKAIEIDYNNGYFINFNNYPLELYQKWKMCLYS